MREPVRRHLPADQDAIVLEALRRAGVRTSVRERALRRWRHGHPADECQYGHRDQINAWDCGCEGCIESICYLFFDQAVKVVGRPTP